MRSSNKPVYIKSRLNLWISFYLLLVTLPQLAWADRSIYQYYLDNIGDRGSVQLVIENTTTYQKKFDFGPQNGKMIEQTLKQFEQANYIIQCHKRNDLQTHPKLTLKLDQDRWIPPFVVRENDPKAIIWIEAERKFKQSLDPLFINAIKQIHNHTPITINATQFPQHLSALSRTRMLMTSLRTLSSLPPKKRRLIKMIVAAGATLVIGTGEMGGDEKVLEEFTSVALGDVKSNSGALLENMMRVPSYRTLYMQGNTYPLVMADNAPIVVEGRLGMGRIRVLAVKLNTLTSNPITTAALTIDETPQEQLHQWLDMSMPPLNSPPRLLRNQLWLLLLLIPILFWISRGKLIHMFAVTILWVLLAIIQAPLNPVTIINQAHQLYLPLDQGALVLGQVDISSYLKGARSELAYPMQFALVSAETEGACLVHDFQNKHTRSWWILDSEVGKRQRFKYIAYVNSIPRNHNKASTRQIPKWPSGPWSSVVLQPLAPISQDLPLPAELKQIKAWRLPSTPPFSPPDPLILTESQ